MLGRTVFILPAPLPVASFSVSLFLGFTVCFSTSVTAKRPIMTGIISIPERSVELPHVNRAIPSIGSMPTQARRSPKSPEIRVFTILSLSRQDKTESPRNDTANNSEGPNFKATVASCGDTSAMANAATRPPTADAISENPSALPASPLWAIG